MIVLALILTLTTVGMIGKLILQDVKQIDEQIKSENMKNGLNEEIRLIIQRICIVTGVTPEQLESKSRKREFVIARQVASYKIRERFGELITWQRISDLFNRDHATAMHGHKSVKNGIETNDPFVLSVLEKYESVDLNSTIESQAA